MKSGTSCSKRLFYPVLWRKNMTRFWPIWAAYVAIWAVLMPLHLLASRWHAENFARVIVRDWATKPAVVMAAGFGILSAMAVFSYLYNNKSAGMLHALPVRREGLFLTNYLSGLCFMVLPQGVIFLLTLGAEALAGAVDVLALVQWLVVQAGCTLFFYSFAVFCAMFTGHILALPVFYGILNFLVLVMYFLLEVLCNSLVFGYVNGGSMGQVVYWLTPMVRLWTELKVCWYYGGTPAERVAVRGVVYVLAYAAAGLVLAAVALVIYRRRQLEEAGEVVTVDWVRPIFKYGVAFCSAVSVGMLIYTWFFGANMTRRRIGILLLFLLVCGAVGYFVAEMLLKKSFRVLKKGWKGCVCFLCAMVLLTAGLLFDWTGYERRVPDPARIQGAEISCYGTWPGDSDRNPASYSEDPEYVALVTRFHRAVTERRNSIREDPCAYSYSSGRVDGADVFEIQIGGRETVQLRYVTLGGEEIRRSYVLPVREEDLADPDSPSALLTQIINWVPNRAERYFEPDWQEKGVRLAEVYVRGLRKDVPGLKNITLDVKVESQYHQMVLDAVQADLAAGRLGKRYLLMNGEELSQCYAANVQFTFLGGGDEREPDQSNGSPAASSSMVRVTLQKGATETLAALEKAGMLEKIELISQAEEQSRNVGDMKPASADIVS